MASPPKNSLMHNGFFITGTGTEVGKTVVTAALAHLLRQGGDSVGVMKPVATGCVQKNGTLVSEDVERLVQASQSHDSAELVSPYRFKPPVAPWVALGNGSGLSTRKKISFDRIEQAYQTLRERHRLVLVEGIGGLLVPLDRDRTVLDLAQRLKLPLLLVVHAGLGTLNHTLLTVESARARGLKVAGLILNQQSKTRSLAEKTNPDVLRKLTGLPILGVIPKMKDPSPAQVARYLQLGSLLRSFGRQGNGSSQTQRLAQVDRKHVWHPFTQQADWQQEEPLIIESAQGVWLTDTRGRRYLDGVSSLWVNLHGHRHPALDQALKRQIEKIAHSTLLGAANVPSIELAQALIDVAPQNLKRVFYSDSGSTAVEIALKMAFQYWQQNGQPSRRKFVHFVDAYHGDTIGSVSVGGIDLFHQVYRPLLFKGFKMPSPGSRPSRKSFQSFEQILRKHHREIAGVVVEPLVQGASGMLVQPKGWLKAVERLCRKYDVFLIADEVAVGFGRTGTLFACEQEKVRPDLLCLAKGLSGGYLPLAATLTSERIYKGFLGSYASQKTFFHGHSYTGNPLGCAVALENLKLFKRQQILKKLAPKIRLFKQELARFEKLPHVKEVRQKGLMAGVELIQDKNKNIPYPWQAKMGIQICAQLRQRGILLRPLGNVVVLMPPLSISQKELRFLCRETYEVIRELKDR